MATHIFRVTVKGRFADLDPDVRARLRDNLDRFDYSLAGHTDAGTLMYDATIDFFTFRVRLREVGDDWQEAHDAVCAGAKPWRNGSWTNSGSVPAGSPSGRPTWPTSGAESGPSGPLGSLSARERRS